MQLCYGRPLRITLNGVSYVRVPDVLSSSKLSVLQAQLLLSYWQKHTLIFKFSVLSTVPFLFDNLGRSPAKCFARWFSFRKSCLFSEHST